MPQVTGSWVDHPNEQHIGLYDPRSDCPEWAEDFNCLRPYPPAQPNPDLAAREFRKVTSPACFSRRENTFSEPC